MIIFINVFLSASEISNWCYTFINVYCMTISFVNSSWKCTVVDVSAPYKHPANAEGLRGSAMEVQWLPWQLCEVSLRAQWNKWYSVQAKCKRCRRALRTWQSCSGVSIGSVRSPCKCALMCIPAACTRRPRGALGDLATLLLRCCCEPKALPRHSFRTPWKRWATAHSLCMPQMRAMAWCHRRPHSVQWRCHGYATTICQCTRRSHCVHLVRTPSWCDRGFKKVFFSK